MEKSEIIEKITKIFRKTFNEESLVLKEEMTANDVDNWNSLSHMIMISEVEKEFSIKFKLKDLNRLKNVGSLIEIVESRLV